MASSKLCALLLALTKTITIDVKTMTDIVKPIANILADTVAPIHSELTVVAADTHHHIIREFAIEKSLAIPLNTSRASSLTFLVMFSQSVVLTANTHVLPSVGMSTQVILV